jgi:hypothetical protein
MWHVLAEANSLPGSQVPLTGMDDGGKTLWHYLTTYGVQFIGGGTGLGGLVTLARGHWAEGGVAAGAGGGMLFVPAAMQSGAQHAQAATWTSLTTTAGPEWLGLVTQVLVEAFVLLLVVTMFKLCWQQQHQKGVA